MTKLELMLKYVSEHNDFYKKRIKEYGIKDPLDITQWPVLTRKELQENRYNMFSDGYKSKYLIQQLRRHSSSGSSGIPVDVYWDTVDYYRSMMSLWRKRKKWYGILPSHKEVSFTLSHTNQINESHNVVCLETKHQLHINASTLTSEDAYKAVINRIWDFRPKWIYIQPFILEQLIYYYKKNGLKYPNSLTHIDSVGEILTKQLRSDTLNLFNVTIANLYGSEEQNGIAYECPYGNMHIMEDNVYVEKNALITNLNNYAFPLIRYNQGDKINLCDPSKSCECGSSLSCISSIEGRITRSFNVAGTEVNEYLLKEIIDIVNNQFNGMIKNYSFSYSTGEKLLTCYIGIRSENVTWTESIIHETEKALQQRLPVYQSLYISVVKQNEKVQISKPNILTITN